MYKFSIITAGYNNRENLEVIIEGLKRQTYKDFEWIYCDDASTDGTKEFFKNKPFLGFPYKYIRRKINSNFTIGKNINNGIKAASGDYCLFIMGDSFLHEEHLSELERIMDDNVVLCGIRQDIDRETNMIVDADYRLKKNLIPSQTALLPTEPYNRLTGNGLCIPRKALKEVNNWTIIKGYGGDDNILMARLYANGYVFYSVPSAIIYHYHHGRSFPNDKQMKYVRKQIKKIMGL